MTSQLVYRNKLVTDDDNVHQYGILISEAFIFVLTTFEHALLLTVSCIKVCK